MNLDGHFRTLHYEYMAVTIQAYSSGMGMPENGLCRAENGKPRTKVAAVVLTAGATWTSLVVLGAASGNRQP